MQRSDEHSNWLHDDYAEYIYTLHIKTDDGEEHGTRNQRRFVLKGTLGQCTATTNAIALRGQ